MLPWQSWQIMPKSLFMVSRRQRVLGPGVALVAAGHARDLLVDEVVLRRACGARTSRRCRDAGPVSGVEPWQPAQRIGRLFGSKPPSSSCLLRIWFSLLWQPVLTQFISTETGDHRVRRASFGATLVAQDHLRHLEGHLDRRRRVRERRQGDALGDEAIAVDDRTCR